MKRNFRLTQARDFLLIKNDGLSKHHKLVVLGYIPNDLSYSRMACVTSKAVGNAVTRNLVKRRMKACVTSSWSKIKTGWDLVFYSRSVGATASYNEWQEAIHILLRQADLFNR
ncbi:MAG: ribonuclease P protein component [Pelolinea sp.]|nr:ribonuclease P protein component [Pelolinea sp.]